MLQDVLRDANDASKPLDSVLRTAMMFAYSLDYQPLIDWVNAELDGYPNNKNLPDYRWFRSEIHASFIGPFWTTTEERSSESVFPDGTGESIGRVELLSGVRNLEETAGRTDIIQSLPSFVIDYLSDRATDGFHCQRAWLVIPPGAIAQTLSAVRTRLMRFCLTIQREFPHLDTAEPTSDRATVPAPAVAYYFNTIVMGENASIALGDMDIVSQVNNVRTGDFDSFATLFTGTVSHRVTSNPCNTWLVP